MPGVEQAAQVRQYGIGEPRGILSQGPGAPTVCVPESIQEAPLATHVSTPAARRSLEAHRSAARPFERTDPNYRFSSQLSSWLIPPSVMVQMIRPKWNEISSIPGILDDTGSMVSGLKMWMSDTRAFWISMV